MGNDSNLPSLGALLGLVAVAGYQNRDKISEFVNGISGGASSASGAQVPGGIAGALGGLISQFQANGAGPVANSWVGSGANLPINGTQLSQALGPDLVNRISTATGIAPDQILSRLSQILPQVVDGLTPKGQLPKA